MRNFIEILTEALKPIDKKVVNAFLNHKTLEGKFLYTDGNELEKMGMGGHIVAKWSGKNNIEFTGQDTVKSDEEIKRYLKKTIPKKLWMPEIVIKHEVRGVIGDQINMSIYIYLKKTNVVIAKLDYNEYKKEFYIDFIEVSEKYRGMELGKKLFEHLIKTEKVKYKDINLGDFATSDGNKLIKKLDKQLK